MNDILQWFDAPFEWMQSALSQVLVLGMAGFVALTFAQLLAAGSAGRRRYRIWRA